MNSNVNSLNEIIKINDNFKTAVNLYLSLNKKDKILAYIPTSSSSALLNDFLQLVINNKEQANILIGPYGKGKSHLLLVLLAILTMDRNNKACDRIIKEISEKFNRIAIGDINISETISYIWNKKGRFLPVIINNSNGDLNQAFLMALSEALNRDNLNIELNTYYSVALDSLERWKNKYPDTLVLFKKELKKYDIDYETFFVELKNCSRSALKTFSDIYPKVTAGSSFNPLTVSEILPLYKSVSERLVEDFGYSGIYIIFDEFSKFIESQSDKAAGSNMKLLQDMCELAADSSKDAQIFFTMVAHKSIKEYGKYLSTDIINSFTGIEGRIIEKYFVTSSKNNYELIKNAIVKDEELFNQTEYCAKYVNNSMRDDYYNFSIFKSDFGLDFFDKILLKGCFPLNPLASYLLLNVSEKVAQNERTLFSFISNDEPNSMARYILNHTKEQSWIVGADLIYDYFSGLFKKDINNEFIHSIWLSAEYSLSKCITEEERKIVKTLAIILIINKPDELPANERYIRYASSLYSESTSIIENLKNKSLIYVKGSSNSYVFKTRAGSELRQELKRQRAIKGNNVNYCSALEKISGKHFVIPRRYNSIMQMTRYFEHRYLEANVFLATKRIDTLLDGCKADGLVISLYSSTPIAIADIEKHIEFFKTPKLVVVCPKKVLKIDGLLLDYEILQELKENQKFIKDNEIITKELPLLEEDITKEVLGQITKIYIDDNGCKILYYNSQAHSIIRQNVNQEEEAVNNCCYLLYWQTPKINNELINRHSINTVQTKKARINIIDAILKHQDNENFYSGTSQEATVYRSLFIKTKLLCNESSKELIKLIKNLNSFVDFCTEGRMPLTKIIDKLTQPPFGIREGIIPIYLAYVLSKRNEDIVVYYANLEIPLSADIIVKMCEAPEDYELYVSKEDFEKEKYIENLNRLFDVKNNRNLSGNRIKDIVICMQRWFRGLPQATRNATAFDRFEANKSTSEAMNTLKKYLQRIEINPYEVLFVALPNDFKVAGKLLETYEVIKNVKISFDTYMKSFELGIVNAFYEVFGNKKNIDLFHLLKDWFERQSVEAKQDLCDSQIATFMTSIDNLNIYDDVEVANKIAKSVVGIFVDNWSEQNYDNFLTDLSSIKKRVEEMKRVNTSKFSISLKRSDKDAKTFSYQHADENTGSILRNILEDTLEEYDDLSVNDRVSILVDLIEKIIC